MNNWAGLLLNKENRNRAEGGHSKNLQGPSPEPLHTSVAQKHAERIHSCCLDMVLSGKAFSFAYLYVCIKSRQCTCNGERACACVCIAVASNTLQMVKCVCGEERKRTNASQLEYTLMRNTDTKPRYKQRTLENITLVPCKGSRCRGSKCAWALSVSTSTGSSNGMRLKQDFVCPTNGKPSVWENLLETIIKHLIIRTGSILNEKNMYFRSMWRIVKQDTTEFLKNKRSFSVSHYKTASWSNQNLPTCLIEDFNLAYKNEYDQNLKLHGNK